MARRHIPTARRSESRTTEFGEALDRHLNELKWTPQTLGDKSRENFTSGISRGQAYGITARREAKDWRPPTRQMINLIAHTLAAGYEATKSQVYSRENVEMLLEELLREAGFSSHEWVNDQWDEIIDAPFRESIGEDPSRLVRVGFFSWPGMAELQFSRSGGQIIGVKGKSTTLVEWLLSALRLPTTFESIPLGIADLYDRGLFMRVDLVAPFIGIPARRLSIGYSKPIGGWRIGQNLLVHCDFESDILSGGNWMRPIDLPKGKIRAVFVRGGVSEQMVDELDLPTEGKEPCETFDIAVEKVAIAPQMERGRVPCFVGDSATCEAVMARHPGKLVQVLKNNFSMESPLVFGLPQRPEVLETVNLALELLEILKHDDLADEKFIPGGIRRSDKNHLANEQRNLST